jgi:hypothetical protein
MQPQLTQIFHFTTGNRFLETIMKPTRKTPSGDGTCGQSAGNLLN